MNDDTLTEVQRVEAETALAFSKRQAAALLNISVRSLFREIAARRIFPTKNLGLIPKTEIVRYLDDQVQLARRSRGPYRKRQTAPTV